MGTKTRSRTSEIIAKHEAEILSDWVERQLAATSLRRDLMNDADLRDESRKFLRAFAGALASSPGAVDLDASAWTDTRSFLADLSRSRARQGYSPTETATFVMSLKEVLFEKQRKELSSEP